MDKQDGRGEKEKETMRNLRKGNRERLHGWIGVQTGDGSPYVKRQESETKSIC